MNVHLAVPDLLWPDRETLPAAAPSRLTAVETLIAKGRRKARAATGLESWLLASWQAQGAAPHSLAADGGRPGDAYWLRADPCSLRVNRDAVVPVDASMFEISREEAEALVERLNGHFSDRGLVFHPLQPDRWYLRVDAPGALVSPPDALPLAIARGRAMAAHPGTGQDAARSAALANEIQMLLHEQPVNEVRERRGEPPVNAVWLWGGGRFATPAARPFRRVRTRDPLAAGLAMASGAAVLPLPDDAERWLRASRNEGVELLVLDALRTPASYGDVEPWREQLVALERAWFAPLADALRRGRIGMITLHAIGDGGTFDAETTRQDLRYFWRRPRPLSTYSSFASLR
jgi:hypothetical protein